MVKSNCSLRNKAKYVGDHMVAHQIPAQIMARMVGNSVAMKPKVRSIGEM